MTEHRQCAAIDGFQEIDIESSTEPGKWYTVVVSDFDAACDCIGYIFNQRCSHIAKARKLRCHWTEADGPPQSRMQRKRNICPLCSGPTTTTKDDDGDTGQ